MSSEDRARETLNTSTPITPTSKKATALAETKSRLKLLAILFVAILIGVGAAFLLLRDVPDTVNTEEPAGLRNGYEYVDLGLTVKWASQNVGSTEELPEGELFAWGEIASKEEFLSENYTYVDNKIEYIKRKANHDAATTIMGRGWYMPTDVEFTELLEQCTWEAISNETLNGYRVTGPNGNSIFMPADALHGYWSSRGTKGDNTQAYALHLSDTLRELTPHPAYQGGYIRAVTQ